jgi:hypothetical protein
MTRISGRPTYHQVYQGNRTKIAHQARRAKQLSPTRVRPQSLCARSYAQERGSARTDILLAIVGGATGFVLGSYAQFSFIKDVIAREKFVPMEQLSYWEFISNPAFSKDYGSVAAGGAIGIFVGGGAILLLYRFLAGGGNYQQ